MPMTTVNAQEMTYSPAATRFALWSPEADSVCVRLYDDALGGKPHDTITLDRDGEMWTKTVRGNLKGQYYTFRVKCQGRWLAESPGVWAKAVGVNGQRGAIIDMRDTNPVGWADDRSPLFAGQQDAILYEMHHRDFSVDASSGIEHKGKYLALTEHGTLNPDGLSTGISHLQQLGITHVHLMPSFDFGSINELTGATKVWGNQQPSIYNWGYDPLNYNVPEGSYSTDSTDPTVRIREFKQMIMALHKAGIRVVMDVVYNHVYDHNRSALHLTAPHQYFRYQANGRPANASGCGNETASEREAFGDYMVASIEYWMREYHIDGFRFDLMAIHDITTMNRIRRVAQGIDPNVVLYGEGWAASAPSIPEHRQASKANTARLGGIAAFCDEMRDGLRGAWDDDRKGAFLIGEAGHEEAVKYGIVGAVQHPGVDMSKVSYGQKAWAEYPSQMIAYVSCHDDLCLADRVVCTLLNSQRAIPADIEATRVRLQMLAMTAVLTSQGVPFIWCGDEMMRSKQGVRNSYASPDAVNQIPWRQKTRYVQVFDYIRSLIAIRKAHPAFRMGSVDAVRRHLKFMKVSSDNVIAWSLNGRAVKDSWAEIIIILNSNDKAIMQRIPNGRYTVACADGRASAEGLGGVNGNKVQVPAQSAMILYR